MNQKFLYIVRRDVAQANMHRLNHHFIDLPDNQVLMSAEFVDEAHQDSFQKTATVQPVAQDEPLSAEHAQVLSHLGVQAGQSLKQVRKLVKRAHPLL